MGRRLDHKLQSIIDDASRNVQSPDAYHSSVAPGELTYAHLNPSMVRHQTVSEPNYLTVGFQSEHPLDDFDRNVLCSDNASNFLDLNVGIPFTFLPSNTTNGIATSVKDITPSIYGRQMMQQLSEHEGPCVSALLATAAVGTPPQIQTTLHEPTAIFHRTEGTNTTRAAHQEFATPLNLSRFASHTPAKNATVLSPTEEHSSPSTRVSLRRIRNRPSALAMPKMSQSDFDDALLLNNVSERQSSINELRAPLKFYGKPPAVQGIQLVSPRELPDRFRQVFPYEFFNAVQSKCFAPVYNTSDNVVVAAPTGSGKTAILELAICKLVQEFGSERFKVVYQAPTKSLCSERVRDWERKFSHLNLPCAELTGDTDNSEMRKVGNAAIIVTTPEKWDSITRKWKDHIKLLQVVKLVLIDEVHMLKDPRGATLEAVVSRMKSSGANVRFIALSATVPNSDDVAAWLGKDHTNTNMQAHRETFGEEFRPVKLEKHVYGFSANINDFAFDSFLDTKLPGLIGKHTVRKPMMIFCVTRKICESTAAKLAEWWSNLRVTERPWPIPLRKVTVGSPELCELVRCGVAFHHAGLDAQDRIAVETGFLKDELSVICCTSTLAVGINLPCHLVIIKNTVCYKDTGLSEYSDLEIMQMLGRAGRPQFDDSATAIIMTRAEKADRYKLMISGQDILESTLHLNLIEHLNSEIGLGTVRDVYSAKRWLAGTFLSVRMRKNPTYYKFSCDTGSRDADERLERICEREIELLKNSKLITEGQCFTCTEYGQSMAKYMVQFETMKLLLSIPKSAKMIQILQIISQSSEFKDLRLKPNERACFREFNKSPLIKSPVKDNISTFAHKVSLIIQIHLGGVDLPMDKEFNIIRRQFQSEKAIIFERVIRLIRCVVECKAYECDAVAACSALELLRSVAAGYWENSTLQLRQIPNIGPAAFRKLVQSNIKSVEQLAALDTATIERIMSRNPPFGKKILDLVASFPRLTLQGNIKKKILKGGEPVKIHVMARLGHSNAAFPSWKQRAHTVTFTASISNGILAHIWRGPLRRLEKGFELTFTCQLTHPTDTVTCQLACEEIVGTMQSMVLVPEIPASAFPISKLTPPLENTATDPESAKCVLSVEEEAEIVAALEAEEAIEYAAPGSEFGEDTVFDDFVDIDEFEVGPVGLVGKPDVIVAEPVRMENGKWRCNHKCRDAQGNYLNKNGTACKHVCCRDGLDKPRKLQKKRSETVPKVKKSLLTEKNSPKAQKKSSKHTSKSKLKLAEHDLSFNELEEIDLANELLEIEQACMISPQDHPTADVRSVQGKPGSIRISKKVPQFSYASGLRPDVSLVVRFDHGERSPPNSTPHSSFPGTEDPRNSATKADTDMAFPTLSDDELELPVAMDIASLPLENFQRNAFGPNAFRALETADRKHSPSLGKKRHAPPSPMMPKAKRGPVVPNDEASSIVHELAGDDVELESEAKKPMPDWVAEFDQDLVAFFGDSVEYAE